MEEIYGSPGVPGSVGTAPHIVGPTASLATNIAGMHIYGNAMLNWLFAMQEQEDKQRLRLFTAGTPATAEEAQQISEHRLNSIDSFLEGGFFEEMKSHADRLATGKDLNFSDEDKKVYKELGKLFKLLMEFHH